jgi:hypothetical protein
MALLTGWKPSSLKQILDREKRKVALTFLFSFNLAAKEVSDIITAMAETGWGFPHAA